MDLVLRASVFGVRAVLREEIRHGTSDLDMVLHGSSHWGAA